MQNDSLTHLSLFTGIGGIDLAAEWAGFTTVGQCEFADFPTEILEKHWPDVPRWRDIRDVTAESFYIRTGLRTINLISGGFPCQPFSVAGNQKGKEDDRYLWPEMLRVIRELTPRWVIGENVPGILSIAGRTVCEDLECAGYDVTVFNFEAAAVGASHRRERVFFVGNAKCSRLQGQSRRRTNQELENRYMEMGTRVVSNTNSNHSNTWRPESKKQQWEAGTTDGGNALSNTNSTGLQIAGYEPRIETISTEHGVEHNGRRSVKPGMGGMAHGLPAKLDGVIAFPKEPDVPRVATGVKDRVDRLKCLGNSVVPQQIYPILQAIADIENENSRRLS